MTKQRRNALQNMLAGNPELTALAARSWAYHLGDVTAEEIEDAALAMPGAYRASDGAIVRPFTDADAAAQAVIGAEANAYRGSAAAYGDTVVAPRLRRFARGNYAPAPWARAEFNKYFNAQRGAAQVMALAA